MASEKAKHLAMLMTAYPSAAESKEQIRALLATMEVALQGVSPKNVERTVNAFIQGRVEREQPTYRPSIADLAVYARRLQDQDDRIAQQARRVDASRRLTHDDDPRKGTTPEQRAAVVEAALERAPEIKAQLEALRQNKPRPNLLAEDRKPRKRWWDTSGFKQALQRIEDSADKSQTPPTSSNTGEAA